MVKARECHLRKAAQGPVGGCVVAARPGQSLQILRVSTPRHPGLASEQQRHDALDTESSRRRYQTLLQREKQGLEPLMERDLVAERRVRTVY